MFQRVAKAEEEEKQCTLGPGPERRGTSGSHEHQRVDFEELELQILDRLAYGEPPAEVIRGDIACKGKPYRRCRDLLERITGTNDQPAEQGEDGIGPFAGRATIHMARTDIFALF